MRNKFYSQGVAAIVAITLAGAALADRGHGDHHGDYHGRGDYRGHGDYHGDHYQHWHGNIHGFHGGPYPHWREGRWYHGYRGSSLGWWWVAGGAWYLYPQPTYPYPEPYPPTTVYMQQPAEVQEDIQDAPAAEEEPPPAQTWYYCDSANKYYPYVASCPEGWQTVPATPPDQ
jgi:hypothetical protein